MKVISVVGARPEFIQAAPLSHALCRQHRALYGDGWTSEAILTILEANL
jgi:UDP-N-acetylglucosamine 2-epimerase